MIEDTKRIRLDKFVENGLQTSRSVARKIIKNKLISVNNNIITKFDYFVKANDEVFYNEQNKPKKVVYKEYRYIMLNKPQNYLCANRDNLHKVVFDLLTGYDTSKLFIVGRLDIDTEGFVLITDDGALAHKLTSPKSKCEKKYFVIVDEVFTKDDEIKFEEGIEIYLDEATIYKCEKAILEIVDKNSAFITITEGKFHQIKKMCKAIGKEVKYLKRIAIGNVYLDESLEVGQYRELNINEENILKN